MLEHSGFSLTAGFCSSINCRQNLHIFIGSACTAFLTAKTSQTGERAAGHGGRDHFWNSTQRHMHAASRLARTRASNFTPRISDQAWLERSAFDVIGPTTWIARAVKYVRRGRPAIGLARCVSRRGSLTDPVTPKPSNAVSERTTIRIFIGNLAEIPNS
jgi:hypothetical protein